MSFVKIRKYFQRVLFFCRLYTFSEIYIELGIYFPKYILLSPLRSLFDGLRGNIESIYIAPHEKDTQKENNTIHGMEVIY